MPFFCFLALVILPQARAQQPTRQNKPSQIIAEKIVAERITDDLVSKDEVRKDYYLGQFRNTTEYEVSAFDRAVLPPPPCPTNALSNKHFRSDRIFGTQSIGYRV